MQVESTNTQTSIIILNEVLGGLLGKDGCDSVVTQQN